MRDLEMRKIRFVLIGNYLPDKQESMQRFANMLSEGLQRNGITVSCWRPPSLLGSFLSTTNEGPGKWMGYFDKWILFPLILLFRQILVGYRNTYFHICDHSNSPYLKFLPADSSAVTCHDVLAIKSGLGFPDTFIQSSRAGVLLQKWILKNLSRSSKIAAVSEYTLRELKDISPKTNDERVWRVIYNGFNAPYFRMDEKKAWQIIAKVGLNSSFPFILHVGSGLPRKNRRMLIEMAALLGPDWDGLVCFAGEALDNETVNLAESLGLENRVVSVVSPDHDTLVALYSTCAAFVFPSLSEGFGWPVIEAQACGAPVIASRLAPMPEVSGGAALHVDPKDAQAMAAALVMLGNEEVRDEMVRKGLLNVHRFNTQRMIENYLDLHGLDIITKSTHVFEGA